MLLGDETLAGWAECLCCGCEWAAAWPTGAEPLECPTCQSVDTIREADFEVVPVGAQRLVN